MFCCRVFKIRFLFCSENPFVSLSFFVSNRHITSLWLGYDLFHMYHGEIPYVYSKFVCTVVLVGACFMMPRRSFLARTGSIEPRRRRKPSMSFVVAGGCRGVLLPRLQDSVFILFKRSAHVTIFFVSKRHGISLWLG